MASDVELKIERDKQHARDLELIMEAARHRGIEIEPAPSISLTMLRIIDAALAMGRD